MSGGTIRAQDIIQAAMVGQRIEQIPKNFDFAPQVARLNQILSYASATGISNENRNSNLDDPMVVTGLRMTQGGDSIN